MSDANEFENLKTDFNVKVIYSGGYVPDLGIIVGKVSAMPGWLVFRHLDGQWVTLADLKKEKIPMEFDEVQFDKIIDAVFECTGEFLRGIQDQLTSVSCTEEIKEKIREKIKNGK